jgi:hypothetical protein
LTENIWKELAIYSSFAAYAGSCLFLVFLLVGLI